MEDLMPQTLRVHLGPRPRLDVLSRGGIHNINQFRKRFDHDGIVPLTLEQLGSTYGASRPITPT